MAIEVRIPTILRTYTDGAKAVEGSGDTLAELFADLETRHHGHAGAPRRRRRRCAASSTSTSTTRTSASSTASDTKLADGDTVTDPARVAVAGGAGAPDYAATDPDALRLPARRGRQHPAGAAAPAVALRRRPDLGQARGPQPDRLGQGPPRAPHDRAGREGRPAHPRAAPSSSPPAATPASRWRWPPSSRATAWSA